MLLTSYRKETIRPECRPEAQSVQCIAHLDQDISEVIPYLNRVFGGFQYIKDPPCVSFRVQGKLIAVYSNQILCQCSQGRIRGRQDSRVAEAGDKRNLAEAWRDRTQF